MVSRKTKLSESRSWWQKVMCVWAILTCTFLAVSGQTSSERPLILKGEVVESMGNTPLMGIKVSLLDSAYNEIDTVRTKSDGIVWRTGGVTSNTKTPAVYKLRLPRKKGKYYIMFEHDKYMPFTKTLEIGYIGGRESERDLGITKLERVPRQLGEVTVTATKVKFFHKGDTMVFNADAFELPEGSMLDALVAQMPGVEIRENGQIYVNGRYVDNLILNGKDFFSNDPSVMLSNLGSYMVKDVAVYEKESDRNKFAGMDIDKKDYVMDVRLKKEYMQGWIANVEGGMGTNSRYLGRLFGMRYTDFTRIALYANVNNLNDNGRQGQSGGFDPTKSLDGMRKHQNAGMEITTNSRDEKLDARANVIWAHTTNNTNETVTRQNFIPGGDTYGYRFGNGKSDSHMVRALASGNYTASKVRSSLTLFADHSWYDNLSDNIEGTFNSEQQTVTRSLLDSMYIPGSGINLGEAVNRIASKSHGKGHDFISRGNLTEIIKIPYTSDILTIDLIGEYGENRREGMKSYLINTGADKTPTYNEGQWTDTRPNRNYNLAGKAEYSAKFKGLNGSIYYKYDHSRKVKNQFTYMLENLSDLGIYGVNPPEEASYSTDDSYWSTESGNTHTVGLKIATYLGKVVFRFEGGAQMENGTLWYNRFGNAYKSKLNTVLPYVSEFGLAYMWGGNGKSRNALKAGYGMKGTRPELEWLLPITDDTDPMNIYEGADNLKNQIYQAMTLIWDWSSARRPLNHSLRIDYTLQNNTLVRGYTYNTTTGVRHIRSYNTSGNWSEGANSILSLQFGPKRKMMLSNNAGVSYGHATDMIGRNVEVPTQSTIRNLFLTETLNLTWQVGRQSIGVKGNAIWRHSTGDREGFKEINSATINYGLTGVFKLPFDFGLSTDLTMYMRDGYNDPGLDKHDLVWNARLSRPFDKGRWVVMVDGFDLLHQLSNVTYDINAQGRTVTYTNSLPRYILLHAIYRIDIKPKKR